MVTKTDNAIVMGLGLLNTLQSIAGNILGSAGHCIWWVCSIKYMHMYVNHLLLTSQFTIIL